jgi:hypothetical protein
MLNNIVGIYGSPTPVSTNSYESISTVTVGGGGQATISFTSIPGTYTHLQIRAIARSAASNDYNVNIKLNSDTGSNYAYHRLYGTGATAAAQAGSSLTYANIAAITTLNSETASAFGAAIIDILDYANTSKYKTVRSLNGRDINGGGTINLHSGLWQSTSAITRIDFTGASADSFAQYSSFALYGIKG